MERKSLVDPSFMKNRNHTQKLGRINAIVKLFGTVLIIYYICRYELIFF